MCGDCSSNCIWYCGGIGANRPGAWICVVDSVCHGGRVVGGGLVVGGGRVVGGLLVVVYLVVVGPKTDLTLHGLNPLIKADYFTWGGCGRRTSPWASGGRSGAQKIAKRRRNLVIPSSVRRSNGRRDQFLVLHPFGVIVQELHCSRIVTIQVLGRRRIIDV